MSSKPWISSPVHIGETRPCDLVFGLSLLSLGTPIEVFFVKSDSLIVPVPPASSLVELQSFLVFRFVCSDHAYLLSPRHSSLSFPEFPVPLLKPDLHYPSVLFWDCRHTTYLPPHSHFGTSTQSLDETLRFSVLPPTLIVTSTVYWKRVWEPYETTKQDRLRRTLSINFLFTVGGETISTSMDNNQYSTGPRLQNLFSEVEWLESTRCNPGKNPDCRRLGIKNTNSELLEVVGSTGVPVTFSNLTGCTEI